MFNGRYHLPELWLPEREKKVALDYYSINKRNTSINTPNNEDCAHSTDDEASD